jgi:hypothetical protein
MRLQFAANLGHHLAEASERAPAHLTCRRLIWARNTPGLDTQVVHYLTYGLQSWPLPELPGQDPSPGTVNILVT